MDIPEELCLVSTGVGPPRRSHVLSISRRGFHCVAYTDWGDERSPRIAVCVHGLTRQGRDFDPLARVLAGSGYRVVCPDLVGRGRSSWLRDPDEYALPQYAMDLAVLLARLDVEEVDWIGTSLGGLVGIVLAGQCRFALARASYSRILQPTDLPRQVARRAGRYWLQTMAGGVERLFWVAERTS